MLRRESLDTGFLPVLGLGIALIFNMKNLKCVLLFFFVMSGLQAAWAGKTGQTNPQGIVPKQSQGSEDTGRNHPASWYDAVDNSAPPYFTHNQFQTTFRIVESDPPGDTFSSSTPPRKRKREETLTRGEPETRGESDQVQEPPRPGQDPTFKKQKIQKEAIEAIKKIDQFRAHLALLVEQNRIGQIPDENLEKVTSATMEGLQLVHDRVEQFKQESRSSRETSSQSEIPQRVLCSPAFNQILVELKVLDDIEKLKQRIIVEEQASEPPRYPAPQPIPFYPPRSTTETVHQYPSFPTPQLPSLPRPSNFTEEEAELLGLQWGRKK
jgi:hypothetical protein